MKTRRIIFMMVVIALILSMVSACVNTPTTTISTTTSKPGGTTTTTTTTSTSEEKFVSDPNLNEPGVFPIAKETVKLTLGLGQNERVSDYVDNKYTKLLQSYTNVELEFVLLPNSELAQKIELMIAAGGNDLPDMLIGGVNERAAAIYGAGGFLVALNDYIEHSSYYFKMQYDRVADKNLIPLFTSPDGNIYTVPQYRESIVNEFNARLWVYEPWLTKSGMAMPETIDEYRNFLVAIRDGDYNENGKKDEIPLIGDNYNWMGSYLDFLTTPFIYSDGSRNWLIPDNGQITLAYMQDEWREALRFINGLVADKLIADVSFTQTQDEAYAIMKNPDITLVGTAVMPSPSSLAPDDTRRVEYITGYPLKKDANSKAVSIQKPAVPSYCGFITKNCEFPETAFRVFDTMLSDEMTMHNRWGEHGTDWTDPNPGDKGAYDELGYPAMLYPVLVWGSVQNSHWSGVAPDWRDYGPAAGMIVDYSNLMVSSFTLECAKSDIFQIAHKPDEVVFKIVYTGEEMDELSELEATITTYVKEARAEFAMGISSLDTGWDAYIAELKKMGVERYLEIVQTAYSRMMGG